MQDSQKAVYNIEAKNRWTGMFPEDEADSDEGHRALLPEGIFALSLGGNGEPLKQREKTAGQLVFLH